MVEAWLDETDADFRFLFRSQLRAQLAQHRLVIYRWALERALRVVRTDTDPVSRQSRGLIKRKIPLSSAKALRHHRARQSPARACFSACKVWLARLAIKWSWRQPQQFRAFKPSTRIAASRSSWSTIRTLIGRNISAESACTVSNRLLDAELRHETHSSLPFPLRWLWHPSGAGRVQWNIGRRERWVRRDGIDREFPNGIKGKRKTRTTRPVDSCWPISLQTTRSFRPDFVLVRQAPRDGAKDYRSTLLGFKFGGVPSINSLNSLLQFQVSSSRAFRLLFPPSTRSCSTF